MKLLTILALSLALQAGDAGPAESMSAKVLVLSCEGAVECRNSPDDPWLTLKPQARLGDSAQVRTGQDGTAHLLYMDNQITRIDSGKTYAVGSRETHDRSEPSGFWAVLQRLVDGASGKMPSIAAVRGNEPLSAISPRLRPWLVRAKLSRPTPTVSRRVADSPSVSGRPTRRRVTTVVSCRRPTRPALRAVPVARAAPAPGAPRIEEAV